MKFVEKRKSQEMKSKVIVLILRENLPMWSLGTFGSDFRKLKEGNKTLMPNPKQKTASNESKKANPCFYSILYNKMCIIIYLFVKKRMALASDRPTLGK